MMPFVIEYLFNGAEFNDLTSIHYAYFIAYLSHNAKVVRYK